MSAAASRGDRRRRVLNEEVLSASREIGSYAPDSKGSHPARRFVLASGELSHAIVHHIFPRSHWFIVGSAAITFLLTAGLVGADFSKSTLAVGVAAQFEPLIDAKSPVSLAKNFVTLVSSLATIACVAILIVRRRRSDDFKGSYRRWRYIAGFSAVVTVCSATGLHVALSAVLSQSTGVSALPQNAVWWIVPGSLAAALLGYWLYRELLESPVATVLAALGTISVVASLVLSLLEMPATFLWVPVATQIAAPVLLLLSLLAFSRHIAAQAISGATVTLKIAKPEQSKKAETKSTPVKSGKASASTTKSKAVVANETSVKQNKDSQSSSSAVQWTDGSEGDEADDDGKPRKLSKAERKRLRRAQQKRRAA